ncbi:hypothetical protein GALMADRAFT_522253 [Galerina marginata CBS 339.88]|uniref:HIT-type domain-containing protein n=1 Tax=Galerina marginata (strain CBS 339.88) TaxID=685588 RepID=A0A067SVU0_GALM3|nr:hypothetical protein GALMADRAFT_522253 [Galerina marginata CBS 339.88]
MAPKTKRPPRCQICLEQDHKYTCPQCRIVYSCSLACYKKHKESSCVAKTDGEATQSGGQAQSQPEPIEATTTNPSRESPPTDHAPLRPLTSLNWPYVPDESAFPDPLKRDDPKTLQISQYEAIATSPSIRKILSEHKHLPDLLTSIDKLRGSDREYALQKSLGITTPEIDDQLRAPELGEDVLALRELAEAIEAAVRGGNKSALGLNWGV